MPDWNPRANEIFLEAVEIENPGERRRFVDDKCSGDDDLRSQVDSLLAASEKLGDFLMRPAGSPSDVTEAKSDGGEPTIGEGPGSIVGPYKLLQKIGEGGFGVVFMAEQDKPVRRMVALKIIKPGMDTREVIARFESERQALAMMDHPHIARVLDAGATESGRPYFVMELVRGVPITDFCDKNHMGPEERLKLFIDVCHAIQHAHHKGIIHRDIKPSNVMVTLHDGVPVVKVIDFGVAKATIQKLTERTLFTAFGQMIGTPAYMSPEQAEMSGLDIDTRSDVYSMGVLLYELLTGTTPLESRKLRQAGYAEMQRMIREEEPPRPSARLSSLGDTATTLAGNRGTEPRRLAQLLSGDLDWIVMKALAKDRDRRYGTPGTFAEDVDRYLRGDAILARPPSTVYRLKKFAQRNRAAVLTTAFVALALVVGTVFSSWQAIRATRAEVKTLALLDEAEHLRALEVEARQRAEASERNALASAAAEMQAIMKYDLLGGHDTLTSMNNLAWLLATTPDVKQRDPAIALELAQKASQASPNNSSFLGTLGTVRYRTGDWKGAIADLEKAISLRKPDDPASANEAFFLAMAHWRLGAKDKAREWFAKADAWMQKGQTDNAELKRFRAEAVELMGAAAKP